MPAPAVNPSGTPLRGTEGPASAAGAFPSLSTKGGISALTDAATGETCLVPTAREPEPARLTTSTKEGAGETLERRPDLPSEEGLKRSHAGSSSVAEPEGKEGEKGGQRV
jgi:hypothetical protein